MKWVIAFLILISLWIILEFVVQGVAQKGIETDFYGGISRSEVRGMQSRYGVKFATGSDWLHLAWIADPEKETYRIEHRQEGCEWSPIGGAKFGSWLGDLKAGDYRVIAVEKVSGTERKVDNVAVTAKKMPVPGYSVPRIASEWQSLFKPKDTGHYINDHCIYQDREGDWRLLGITSHTRGDYRREVYFASASGEIFPPKQVFAEDRKTADFGSLAWAPDVIEDEGTYHLFWSPHQLHHMESDDGIEWKNHRVIMTKPMHPFFRDAVVYRVAPRQWLLYATGRGKSFSRIDIYQSFDLVHWQYIRPAVRCAWGSEKNFVTGSMESPALVKQGGNYYLSTTYNNDSFFWTAILLQLGIILNRKGYNNTLMFGSHNPYDFGIYRGRRRTERLVGQLEAHAPVYLRRGERWFVTTCGWPFAASLTGGEVAWAEMRWIEPHPDKK
jgi:hypothetical protein